MGRKQFAASTHTHSHNKRAELSGCLDLLFIGLLLISRSLCFIIYEKKFGLLVKSSYLIENKNAVLIKVIV